MTRTPSEYLPLTPATLHILLALSGGEKHGYAMMREVDELSNGAVRLGPGTLYRSIKRMLDDGFIEEASEQQDPTLDDERRRYYRLAPFGAQTLALETARLERLLSVARQRRADRPVARISIGDA